MSYYIPPRQHGEPGAEPDPERLVCGLAASLSEWRPDQFEEFLAWFAAGNPVPLRLDHERWQITARGGQNSIGRCLRFAAVAPGTTPGGLLCLAELGPDWAESILSGMRKGEWLAMSVRGQEYGDDLLIREISLVDRVGNQKDPAALVISYGPAAATTWSYLSGQALT